MQLLRSFSGKYCPPLRKPPAMDLQVVLFSGGSVKACRIKDGKVSIYALKAYS
jgi:hypothetical protein